MLWLSVSAWLSRVGGARRHKRDDETGLSDYLRRSHIFFFRHLEGNSATSISTTARIDSHSSSTRSSSHCLRSSQLCSPIHWRLSNPKISFCPSMDTMRSRTVRKIAESSRSVHPKATSPTDHAVPSSHRGALGRDRLPILLPGSHPRHNFERRGSALCIRSPPDAQIDEICTSNVQRKHRDCRTPPRSAALDRLPI